MPDGRLIVCTDQGEIMLLEGSGDYKMLLAESPGEGFFIETIIVYSKGFIIGGENGQIMIYEKSEEPKNPYHRIATLPTTTDAKSDKDYPMLMAGVMSSKVRCMSLNATEDSLVFTTENNQLMRVPINIERPTDDAKYEYLIYHSTLAGSTAWTFASRNSLLVLAEQTKLSAFGITTPRPSRSARYSRTKLTRWPSIPQASMSSSALLTKSA